MKHWCQLCQRYVVPKRRIGGFSWLMVLCTVGTWLLLLPFYPRRCPICNGLRWGSPPQT